MTQTTTPVGLFNLSVPLPAGTDPLTGWPVKNRLSVLCQIVDLATTPPFTYLATNYSDTEGAAFNGAQAGPQAITSTGKGSGVLKSATLKSRVQYKSLVDEMTLTLNLTGMDAEGNPIYAFALTVTSSLGVIELQRSGTVDMALSDVRISTAI